MSLNSICHKENQLCFFLLVFLPVFFVDSKPYNLIVYIREKHNINIWKKNCIECSQVDFAMFYEYTNKQMQQSNEPKQEKMIRASATQGST
jgi:Zn-finger protein